MSTGVILGAVGAVVGNFIAPGTGAYWGWAIGSAIGGYYDYTQMPDVVGPRLDDLKAQVSAYGHPVALHWGRNRVAGNVIWKTDLVEHEHSQDSKGGGPEQKSYTYTCSFAVLASQGEVDIIKVWANKRLILALQDDGITWFVDPVINGGVDPAQVKTLLSAGLDAYSIGNRVRIYRGTEDQEPDPLIVAHKGHSPAYRGYTYIVFDSMDLSEHFGNRLPQIEFELAKMNASPIETEEIYTVENPLDADSLIYNSVADELWITADRWEPEEFWFTGLGGDILRIDPETGALLGRINLPSGGGPWLPLALDEVNGYVWAYNSTKLWRINAADSSIVNEYSVTGLGAIKVDPYTGALWGRKNSSLNVLRKYDLTGNEVLTITFADDVYWWEFSNTEIWASAIDITGKLFRVNKTGGTPTEAFTNDTQINFLAYDEARNALHMLMSAEGSTGEIWDLNLSTLTVSKTTSISSGGASMYGRLSFDDATGVLWFSRPEGAATSPAYGKVWGLRSVDYSEYHSHDFTNTAFAGPAGVTLAPGTPCLYTVVFGTPSGVYKIWRMCIPPLAGETPTLDQVVSDICLESGLNEADIDVTDLAVVPVLGYTLGRQTNGRAAIEALQPAYHFDGVESEDLLKFIRRGGAPVATIPQSDRGVRPADSAPIAPLTITHANEFEVPHQIDLKYIDPQRAYEQNTVYERRLTRESLHTISLECPVVLSQLEASRAAAVNLYLSWQRRRFQWTTNLKYAHLEPTDVVTLVTAAASYSIRIIDKKEFPNGVIEWGGVAEDAITYQQNGVQGASNYPPQTVFWPGTATVMFLDIPILRDDDNDAGWYGAVRIVDGDGNGVQLYKSLDAGTTYNALVAITAEAAIGTASSVLATFTGGNVFDYVNTVDVAILDGGTLSSLPELAVLNGGNTAILGNEVIQFKTATLISPGVYRLSELLRGRFGTEWAMTTHAMSERFVLASLSTWQRIPSTVSEIGLERPYKGVVFGSTLASAPPFNYTNTAVGLKPYAPVHLKGSRDGPLNLTITWVRRSRIGGGWVNLIDVPLGETTEEYEVEIWDSTFSTLKRTFTGITSPSQVYTAAQQTTDFGSTQATVYVRVYQISATVDRGYKLEGSV